MATTMQDGALLRRLASAEVRLNGIPKLLHDVRAAANGWICDAPNNRCTHEICMVLDAIDHFAHEDDLRRRAFHDFGALVTQLEYPEIAVLAS